MHVRATVKEVYSDEILIVGTCGTSMWTANSDIVHIEPAPLKVGDTATSEAKQQEPVATPDRYENLTKTLLWWRDNSAANSIELTRGDIIALLNGICDSQSYADLRACGGLQTAPPALDREAVAALKSARDELAAHNSDYHHKTKSDVIARIDAILSLIGGA